MSKFPPAQGAMLALGQLLTGYPIVGVWLSMGIMSAAICWMLRAWVSPRWAVIGGLLSGLHPYLGINSYWAQSYWGGALAATGGALVLGGIRTALKEPRVFPSLLTGAGVFILSNSRLYEGLLLSICAGVTLLVKLRKHQTDALFATRRIVIPLLLAITATSVCIGYYNFTLTGNTFLLPYQVYEAQYSGNRSLSGKKTRPVPEYRHDRIKNFYLYMFRFRTLKRIHRSNLSNKSFLIGYSTHISRATSC